MVVAEVEEAEAEVGLEKLAHDDLLTLGAMEEELVVVGAKELEPGSCCYYKQRFVVV